MHTEIQNQSGLMFLVPDLPKTSDELGFFFAEEAFTKWANNLNFKEIRYELEHGMARRIYLEELGYSDRYHRWYSISNIVKDIRYATKNVHFEEEHLLEIISDGLPLLQEMARQRFDRVSIVQDENDSKTIHFDRLMTKEETKVFQKQLDYEYIVDLKSN